MAIDQKFSHSWTIENFEYFYQHNDGTRKYPFVYSDNISPFKEKFLNCYLELCPKGFDESCSEHVSLFLCLENLYFGNEIFTCCKISILNNEDKIVHRFEQECVLLETTRLGSNNFISQVEFFDKEKQILFDNKLVILCEIQFTINPQSKLFKEYELFMTKMDTKLLNSSSKFNAKSEFISFDSIWTFKDFSCFYKNAFAGANLPTVSFPGPNKRSIEIELGIESDKDEHEDDIFICMKVFRNIEVQFRISLLDGPIEKILTFGSSKKFSDLIEWKWRIRDNVYKETSVYLLNDKLEFYCEIQIPEEVESTKVQKQSKINKAVPLTKHLLTAHPKVIDSFAHKWTVDNFNRLYENGKESKFDVIESQQFSSNLDDKLRFNLEYYRSQDKNECCSIGVVCESFTNDTFVQFSISIIDEQNKKCVNKVKRWKFNSEMNRCHLKNFEKIEIMLNTYLIEQKIRINCKVQILENENGEFANVFLQDNQILQTESYFNVKPKMIDSFVHKWTIENFNSFYEQNKLQLCEKSNVKFLNRYKDWFKVSSFISLSCTGPNLKLKLYLEMDSKIQSNDHEEYLSLLIKKASDEKEKCKTYLKLSILNEDDDKRHTIEKFQLNDFCSFSKYILIQKLFNEKKKLFQNGSLVLLCEVEMLQCDSYTTIGQTNSVMPDDSYLSWMDGDARLTLLTCKWTVDNFKSIFDDNNASKIYSKNYFNSNNPELQIYFGIKPLRYKNVCDGILIYSNLASLSASTAFIHVSFKILDEMENTFRTVLGHDNKGRFRNVFFEESDKIFLDSIYHTSIEEEKLFKNNKLTILCEFCVLEDFTVNIEDRISFDLYRGKYIPKLSGKSKRDSHQITSKSNAKAELIKFEYIWSISDIRTNKKEYIESSTFSPENKEYLCFKLCLYPNGCNDDSKEHVSVFLNKQTDNVLYQFKISIIDCTGIKSNTKGGPNKFLAYCQKSFKSCAKYISHSELFNPLNGLLKDDALTLLCQIKMIEQSNEHSKIENSLNQISYSVVPDLLNQSKTKISNTFTQVSILKHKWTIANFLQYFETTTKKNLHKVTSTQFSAFYDEKIVFSLEISQENDSFCVSLKNNFPAEIRTLHFHIKFSIIDAHGANCSTRGTTEIYQSKTMSRFMSYGFSNFTSIPDLLSQSNKLMQDDKLTLLFEMNIVNNFESRKEQNDFDKHVIGEFTTEWKIKRACDVVTLGESVTNLQTFKCSQQFSINNFQQYIKENRHNFLEFPPFSLPNYKNCDNEPLDFYLKVYPNGEDEITKETVIMNMNSSICKEDIYFFFKLWIIDQDQNRLVQKEDERKIGNLKQWEWSDLIHHKDILNSSLGLVENDCLTIYCEFDIVPKPRSHSIELPSIKILPELNVRFHNNQPTDVSLECGIDKIKLYAHKSILSAQSSVFESMFKYDTEENVENCVRIIDFDADVIKEMLRFIYTGEIYSLDNLAIELFMAADKYALLVLKAKSENWLIKILSVNNANDILAVAHLHSAQTLKRTAIDYFHRNAEEVTKTNLFKQFSQNNVDLLIELYQDITRIHKNCNNSTTTEMLENSIVIHDNEEETEEDISVL